MDAHILEVTRDELAPPTPGRHRVALPGEADASGHAEIPAQGVTGAAATKASDAAEGPPTDPTITADRDTRLGAGSLPKPHQRRWLLGTVAILILGASGAGFFLSPYNTAYPIDAAHLRSEGRKLVASVGQQVQHLVAPSARVAHAPQAQLGPPHPRETVTAPSLEDQMREIVALRQGPPDRDLRKVSDRPSISPASREAPASLASVTAQTLPPKPSPAAPMNRVPASIANAMPGAPVVIHAVEQAAAPASGVQAAPAEAIAPIILGQVPKPHLPLPTPPALETGAIPVAVPVPSATVLAAGPAFVPAVAPAQMPALRTAPTDPASVAAELRAAPMTSGGQIEVLNLVARLGIVIRDMRAENAALKSRVESTADRFDVAVADFDRRLALAEARGAINAAMGAEAPAPVAARSGVVGAEAQAASTGGRARASGPPPGVQIVVAPPAGTTPLGGSARYRVTAASPGLAMLSLLDRSGGEGSQLQVAVGDPVPGYGRVTAIQQRGSSWIVQTDKGPDKGIIQ